MAVIAMGGFPASFALLVPRLISSPLISMVRGLSRQFHLRSASLTLAAVSPFSFGFMMQFAPPIRKARATSQASLGAMRTTGMVPPGISAR